MKTLLFILSLFFLLNTSNFSFAQTTWKRFPGKALDIASGPEGTIYIISTSKRVFKWDNQKNIWNLLDGLREVKEIAPMKHGMLLALTQNGKLHYYHPGSKKWKNDWFIAAPGMPSVIQSIHYSPDPKYGVSTLAESVKLVSNNRVYYFRNNRWATWKTERYVKKVAEPTKGIVAYINTDQRIVRYNLNQKSILPGGAMNIAAGADGSLWIVDLDRRLKKLELGSYNFAWQHQKSWDLVEAKQYAIRDLAIDAKGLPWVLSKSNTIYRQVPGEAPDQLEVNDNSKGYILDLQRFCIQNHDEGWGKEEVKAHFYVYKGSKGRPLEAIGGTSIFINSDEGKFKNVRRTKARDLYVNNRKVAGVKLDNFEVHQNEGLIKIPKLRPGDFLIVNAIFNEMDGGQWYPMPLLEKSSPIHLPGQETKEKYYYSHFKMQSYTSTYDLNRRFQDYRDVLLRHYKNREEEKNKLFGKDSHDYIGSDIELYLLGGKWPYENGNYLRLHGKNDAAHYFFEFALRSE